MEIEIGGKSLLNVVFLVVVGDGDYLFGVIVGLVVFGDFEVGQVGQVDVDNCYIWLLVDYQFKVIDFIGGGLYCVIIQFEDGMQCFEYIFVVFDDCDVVLV